MRYNETELDLEFLRTILEDTAFLLDNTWELAFLPKSQAEVVAFLVTVARRYPEGVTQAQVDIIKDFWELNMQDVEEAVFAILHIHEEEITDSLEEDLYVLNLLFPTRN